MHNFLVNDDAIQQGHSIRITAVHPPSTSSAPPRSSPQNGHGRPGPCSPHFTTFAGPLRIVATSTGVPRRYDALRVSATAEHLGGGLRPLVASTSDLIAMAAARGRPEDFALVPQLQRILQLEASPSQLVAVGPGYEMPGPDAGHALDL